MSTKRSQIREARILAETRHAEQMRGNGRGPFIEHIYEVVALVIRAGGASADIVAAYLHDIIEKTDMTFSEIEQRFGSYVTDLVDGLTDPPHFKGPSQLARKKLQAERIKEQTNAVKRIKLADLISNVRSMALNQPTEAERWQRNDYVEYIEGARLVAEECRGISDYLDTEFARVHHLAVHTYGAYRPSK